MFIESVRCVDENQCISSLGPNKAIKSVLFVSHTSRVERPYYDPSVRYRCFNVAEFLHREGIRTHVVSQVELERTERLPKFDAYVFHRPRLTRGLLTHLERLPENSLKIADYDDLVFDVEAAEHSSAVRSRNEPVWSVRAAIAENHGAFRLFDTISVSTEPLREAVLRLNPSASVSVTPNVPDYGYMALARVLRVRRTKRLRPRVGYFSGTNSHNEDFRMASNAIAEFCAATGAEFYLVGPVEVPPVLRREGISLRTAQVKSFHDMALEVASCDFVIAPLAFSRFNQCKSAIKFMEAAVLGVPIVATPIPDVARFQSPLLHKVESPENWGDMLDKAWTRDRSIDGDAAQKIDEDLSEQRGIFASLLIRN